MSGAVGPSGVVLGLPPSARERAAEHGYARAVPPPRGPAADDESHLRQRLAESLRAMLEQVTDGSLELTVVPGAGRAAVFEHRGIRAVLVVDPGAGNGYALSPRELQIARMVAAGATNRAIADALDISLWTVSTHLRRVFAKTGVASRAEMVAELFGGLHVPLDE
jgi:DNA-binding CsgD family transcriptional regulator